MTKTEVKGKGLKIAAGFFGKRVHSKPLPGPKKPKTRQPRKQDFEIRRKMDEEKHFYLETVEGTKF